MECNEELSNVVCLFCLIRCGEVMSTVAIHRQAFPASTRPYHRLVYSVVYTMWLVLTSVGWDGVEVMDI